LFYTWESHFPPKVETNCCFPRGDKHEIINFSRSPQLTKMVMLGIVISYLFSLKPLGLILRWNKTAEMLIDLSSIMSCFWIITDSRWPSYPFLCSDWLKFPKSSDLLLFQYHVLIFLFYLETFNLYDIVLACSFDKVIYIFYLYDEEIDQV